MATLRGAWRSLSGASLGRQGRQEERAAYLFLVPWFIGLALMPALPIILELLERHTGEAEGTAAGLVWCAGNVGGMLVPAVVGLFVDTPLTAFLICAGVALLGIPLLRGLAAPVMTVKS